MKKLILKTAFSVIVLSITLIACQNQTEEILTEPTSTDLQQSRVPAYIGDNYAVDGGTIGPWAYLLDIRYSRTCDLGPGVCFRNGDGDILDYTNVDGMPTSSTVDNISAATPGSDNGGVFVGLEGDRIHMIFTKDIEDKVLYIDEDIRLPEEMFMEYAGQAITIKAGEYEVVYDNYKYGEAFLKIQTPQMSIVSCDVFLTNRIEGGQPVWPADVLNFRVKIHPYWYNTLSNYPNWYCGYVYARFPGSSVIYSFPAAQLLPNNEVIFSNGLPSLLPGGGGGAPLNYQMVYGVGLKPSVSANCNTTLRDFSIYSLSDLDAIFTDTLTSCYNQ